jgi:hypothetical protein
MNERIERLPEPLPEDITALLTLERRALEPLPQATRDRMEAALVVAASVAALPWYIYALRKLLGIGAGPLPMAIVYAAGAASGVAGHALWTHRHAGPAAVVAAPAPRSVTAPEPVTAQPEMPPPPKLLSPHRPAPTHVAVPRAEPLEPPPDDALAVERRLIEMARTALTRGDPAATLSAIAQAEREFPAGQLAEERDVLRIQALLATGKRAEAEQAAETFEAKHPKSLELSAVKAMLR